VTLLSLQKKNITENRRKDVLTEVLKVCGCV